MRRDLALLFGTAAVVAMILGGTFLLPAAERLTRHTDVKAAQPELPSAAALAYGYSGAFSMLLRGDYANASELISLVNSSYVPDSVRYIFSRFNSLLSSSVSDLNQTEALLSMARRSLGVGLIGDAKALAGNASSTLWRANSTASQVAESSAEIASQLKIPQLRSQVGALGTRIDYLAGQLNEIRSEISLVESGMLVRTQISLALDSGEAWVGSTASCRGFLIAEDGSPIAGQEVRVQVGSQPYSAVTGDDGGYSLAFQVPYQYSESITVYAYFSPAESGAGGYAGSRSQDAVLRLLWEKPSVELSLNATRVKPGDWILASGRTGIEGEARVAVSAFGRSWTAQSSGGAFSVAIQVPADAPSGTNRVRAEAIPSGVVGPGYAEAAVEVYRLPALLKLEVPAFALSGSTVRISGAALAQGGSPLPGAEVSVRVGSSTYSVRAGDDGGFSVDAPLGFAVPTGWIEVIAKASPANAAYQAPSCSSGFYAVNPSILAAPAAAAGLIWLSTGRIRGTGGRKGAGAAPSGGAVAAAAPLASPHPESPPAGPAVSAWHKAASALGRLIGSAVRRGETLREFMHRAGSRLGGAPEPFAELTGMAEEELYGGISHEPARPESLLGKVIAWASAALARLGLASGEPKGMGIGMGSGMGMDSGSEAEGGMDRGGKDARESEGKAEGKGGRDSGGQ